MASSSPSVLKLKSVQLARQKGEFARLRVLKGPDRGFAFVLVNTRASIGRGEDNDITLGDLKASRLHAEVVASATGWMVRDLGSANGILHNGVLVRSTQLRSLDLLTIGETVLEFLGAEIEDQRLMTSPQGELEADRYLSSRLEKKDGQVRTLKDLARRSRRLKAG